MISEGTATGVPWQVPPLQTSPVVHALPSSHVFAFAVNVHPTLGTQASVVQGLKSLQTTGDPAWQAPPTHESNRVQAFPSSHD